MKVTPRIRLAWRVVLAGSLVLAGLPARPLPAAILLRPDQARDSCTVVRDFPENSRLAERIEIEDAWAVELSPDSSYALVAHPTDLDVTSKGEYSIRSTGLSIVSGLDREGGWTVRRLGKDDGVEYPLAFAFSPEGDRAFVLNLHVTPFPGPGGPPWSIQVWEGLPHSPRLLRTEVLSDGWGVPLPSSTYFIARHSLLLSPDCRLIVLSFGGAPVYVFQVGEAGTFTYREVIVPVERGGYIMGVAFTPDSQRLLISFTDAGPSPPPEHVSVVALYRVTESGPFLRTDTWFARPGSVGDELTGIAMMPDGDRFVTRSHFLRSFLLFSGVSDDNLRLETILSDGGATQHCFVAGVPEPDHFVTYSTFLSPGCNLKVFRVEASGAIVEKADLGHGQTSGNHLGYLDLPEVLGVARILPPWHAEGPANLLVEADASCRAAVSLEGTVAFEGCAPRYDLERRFRFEWAKDGATVSTSRTLQADLGPGTYRFVFRATDDSGRVSEAVTEVVVVDRTPPVILAATPSPATLWPPDHTLREVCATLDLHDNCDPAPRAILLSASSSEPEDGGGDGETAPDIAGALLGEADSCVLLRAERSGLGGGRTYTLAWEPRDEAGNRGAPVTVEVKVHHDRRPSLPP